MRYEFDWDPVKARQNLKKHGVSFERAARIFLDPFAISIFDEKIVGLQLALKQMKFYWLSFMHSEI